jgi:hypothetical protein
MSLSFEELRKNINDSGVVYPLEIMDHANRYHKRTVIPFPVRVENLMIPGIFIICPETDIDYFKIKIPLPEPDIKYRFMELNIHSVIEIILRFKHNRQLVLHLNPTALIVKHFLRDCIQQGIISFHFICVTRNILGSSFTDFDEEQMEWFSRNYKRSMKLEDKPDTVFYTASEALAQQFINNQRYYKFSKVKR